MFATRYFAARYFAPRYFPKVGADPIPSTSSGHHRLGIGLSLWR